MFSMDLFTLSWVHRGIFWFLLGSSHCRELRLSVVVRLTFLSRDFGDRDLAPVKVGEIHTGRICFVSYHDLPDLTNFISIRWKFGCLLMVSKGG
jgi:hypothetical protein